MKIITELQTFRRFQKAGYDLVPVFPEDETSPKVLVKKLEGKEINVEFCIGDFCVGIYDEKLDILEPKFRAKDLEEAFEAAQKLESKYT